MQGNVVKSFSWLHMADKQICLSVTVPANETAKLARLHVHVFGSFLNPGIKSCIFLLNLILNSQQEANFHLLTIATLKKVKRTISKEQNKIKTWS